MTETFNNFCRKLEVSNLRKLKQAVAFLWFHCQYAGETEGTIADILRWFDAADLPKPNVTRLREGLRICPEVHKGSRAGQYKLDRNVREEFDAQFAYLFAAAPTPTIAERADLKMAPLISDADRQNAHKMAELYVILHCYENSARRLLEKVLTKKLGENWWDTVANVPMKKQVSDRQGKEQRNRWITPRGTSPLFYLDWDDLLTLFRKYEADLKHYIPDFKFLELRFEELERFRNIVAHHGTLPSDDEFQTVILSFKHWCRQVGPCVQTPD